MAHLIETYAANSGSKIKKPKLLEKFYPLDFDKYITIQASSKFPAKCWDYYNELVEFILPTLNEHNIKIVQLGAKDDIPIKNCVNLCGLTSIAQTHFILRHALLHVGNDSFQIHSCSILDTPLVGLYSISPPEICGPYWKNDKQITLMADLQGQKPSYSPQENPKTVNRIKIETVIESISQLLNLKFPQVNSIHFGETYLQNIKEIIPNFQFNINLLPQNEVAHIRADFLEQDLTQQNYQYLLQTAAQRKSIIYIDRPINIEALKQVRPNIVLVVYKLPENDDINFVKQLKKSGLPFRLIKEYKSEEKNDKEIADLKFKYLDVSPIQFVEKKTVNLSYSPDLCMRSNRAIYASGNFYNSKFAFKNNLQCEGNSSKINSKEELDQLTEEQEYLYIYAKN